MMEQVEVSIVIVSFNGKRYLKDCLDSILDQDFPREAYEVMVIDNDSADGSAQFVMENYPSVKVIQLAENVGYFEACNRALGMTRGKYFVGVPQDTVAHKKWLSELVRVADSDDRIKICLANTVLPLSPDYARKERTKWIQYLHLWKISRGGYFRFESEPFSETPVRMLIGGGTSELLKRDFLTQVWRLYDTWGGDAEIGLMANVMGYLMVLVPTAIIYTPDEGKMLTNFRVLRWYFIGSRERLLAYYKCMHDLEFLLYLPLLLAGIPLKSSQLRTGYIQKIIVGAGALLATPAIFVSFLFSRHRVSRSRKEILSKRKAGRFWLLKSIVSGDFERKMGV